MILKPARLRGVLLYQAVLVFFILFLKSVLLLLCSVTDRIIDV